MAMKIQQSLLGRQRFVSMGTVNWKKIVFWTIIFLIWYSWSTGGQQKTKDRNDPVRLWLTPHANLCLQQPCYAHAIVYATQNKDNRWGSLVWWSEEGESGSAFQQLNENSSVVVFDRFIRVSPTNYVFEACIYRLVESKPKRLCNKKEFPLP